MKSLLPRPIVREWSKQRIAGCPSLETLKSVLEDRAGKRLLVVLQEAIAELETKKSSNIAKHSADKSFFDTVASLPGHITRVVSLRELQKQREQVLQRQTLSTEEVRTLDAHLRNCPSCFSRLIELEDLYDIEEEEEGQVSPAIEENEKRELMQKFTDYKKSLKPPSNQQGGGLSSVSKTIRSTTESLLNRSGEVRNKIAEKLKGLKKAQQDKTIIVKESRHLGEDPFITTLKKPGVFQKDKTGSN